ncbi:MAG: NfeD family protein [bacterium]
MVYILPFEGEVEKGLYHVFRRGFDEARAHQAALILIDINTPGGRVDAAWEICDLLLKSKIPTAVFVSGDATSAGAMIALAAEKIFMTPGSTIGTAAPVIVGAGGGEGGMMDEKALSFVKAKFKSIAEIRGHDEDIVSAMVDPEEKVERTNEIGETVVISKEGDLLTLTAPDAVRWGVAEAEVGSIEEVLSRLGLATAEVVQLREAWFERLARFVTSMTVSGLLMTIGVLCIFMEVRTPGFGIPGIVGILCIVLFFWGHSIASLAGWEGPLLFLIGLVLLVIEVFFTPGFGLLGAAGVFAMIVSFIVTLMGRSPISPAPGPSFVPALDWELFAQSFAVVLISVSLAIMGFMASPFLLPAVARTSVGRRFVLDTIESRDVGYHSHETEDDLRGFIGAKGVAYTTLRPAGMAMFGTRKVDVVSEGGFIQCSESIEVVRIEGRRIVVKPV